MTGETSYDTVLYPGKAYPRTHPDHLAALATLCGLHPASPEGCRVLEVGCGDGGNLIPMAYALPGSQFVGIDLAAQPVAAGRDAARMLDIENLELRQLNILDLDASFGNFDYIIAHGVYAWVPPEVQQKVLAVCRDNLSAEGVAFISYNAYPGCRARYMLRDIMLYRVGDVTDPAERLRLGREALQMVVDHAIQDDPTQAALRAEAQALLERPDGVLFHDELGEYYSPLYFHEFIAQAREHGLQYLAETPLLAMQGANISPAGRETLERVAGEDVIAREQYQDFLRLRRFRQTLLCRREASVDRSMGVSSLERLYFAGAVKLLPPPTGKDEGATAFEHSMGARITTNNPVMIAALGHLGAIWPQADTFAGLLHASRSPDAEELAAILRTLVVAEMVDPRATPGLARKAGAHPKASAVARWEAAQGGDVTTLHHRHVEVQDQFVRRLLALLDGTRDRTELLRDLVAAFPETPRELIEEGLDRNLDECGKLALLLE